MIGDFFYEAWYLSLRTLRRFFRVPANWIGIIFFPLIQLFVFSQLFKDIIQLPGFRSSGSGSYLAYLAPGQIAFTAFFAVAWSGSAILVEYRNGYMDKLRATPIFRVSILVGELAPLFIESAIMAGGILLLSVLLGATIKTGLIGAALILVLSGLFGMAWAGHRHAFARLFSNRLHVDRVCAAGVDARLAADREQLESDYIPDRSDSSPHGERL